MHLHCLPIAGLVAHADRVRFQCARCGSVTTRPVEEVFQAYGRDCTVAQVVDHASCRRCGSDYIIATPEWSDEDDD
jgi:ribosomal protein S27AE